MSQITKNKQIDFRILNRCCKIPF